MLNSEYIYHLADPPPKLCDLNEYFTEYVKSRDEKYFYAFLHYYENKLNANVKKFIKRYQISIDCLDDLKQILPLTCGKNYSITTLMTTFPCFKNQAKCSSCGARLHQNELRYGKYSKRKYL